VRSLFSSSELASIKQRAMRKGVWFKILGKIERAIIDLTIKCVRKVHSSKLTKIVVTIVNKLADASKSKLKRLINEIGRSLAQKLSRIAQNWGNKSATQWVNNPDFAQYLAVTHLSLLKDFQIQHLHSI